MGLIYARVFMPSVYKKGFEDLKNIIVLTQNGEKAGGVLKHFVVPTAAQHNS